MSRTQALDIRFSREAELLDTGGGIRRVASFLRESDPSLLIAGDMLADPRRRRALRSIRFILMSI